jgi:hypothetical protein
MEEYENWYLGYSIVSDLTSTSTSHIDIWYF